MADETKQVSVILGPYAGNRLTMPTAEADAAVGAHWALDPQSTEPYPGHEPLSEEERVAALEAARDWAHLQWEHAGNPPPPEALPEGGTRRRAMAAEQPAGYTTREAPKPKQ